MNTTRFQKDFSNRIGKQADLFIHRVKKRWINEHKSLTLTLPTICQLFKVFMLLNQDLSGCKNGDGFAQKLALEWEAYWLAASYQDDWENQKKMVLSLYRKKVIDLAFRQGVQDPRAQAFLHYLSSLFENYSAYESYQLAQKHFMQNFEQDLDIDLKALNRLLTEAQLGAYNYKLEQTLARDNVKLLGKAALNRIFNELVQDKEFIKQLPILLENGESVGVLLKDLPNKKARDDLLNQSMDHIYHDNQRYHDKHIKLVQSILYTR